MFICTSDNYFFCLKAGIYLTIINYVLLSWYKEGLSFNIQINLLFKHLNNFLSFFFANTNAHYLKAVFQIQFNVENLNTNTFFFHWNKGLFGVVFKLGISIVLHIYKTDFFFFQYSSLFLTSGFHFDRVFICLNHSQPILILNFDEEICKVTK